MGHSITPWLHILAATVWVGPQFFLFLAAVPALRTIEDQQVRARVMRIIVTRFGWMAWAALAVLVLTGISNIFQEANDFNHLLNFDYRWVNYFAMKMVLVGFMAALTAYHSFVLGPRQLALNERAGASEAEVAGLRKTSIMISGTVLLLSILVIFVAAVLANHEYTFQQN
jgi:uncharacterized membrane protein